MRSVLQIPSRGTIRVIERFLIFPLGILSHNEDGSKTHSKRWLETAKIEQEWRKFKYTESWRNVRFID